MGRTYKVACSEEERNALLSAVAYLDRKMTEIKSAGRVASAERIAVMAALNITHELLSSRNNASGFAKPLALFLELSSSWVMLSAAMTAMRSALATRPALLISVIFRSRYATAERSALRSSSEHATL